MSAVAMMVRLPPPSMLRAAPKKRLGRRRRHGVVRAAKAGDGVEQDDHVTLAFDKALGFFEHHFADLHMALRRFVERGADDFGILDRALHIRHFFGTFIDEQHDEIDFGMVRVDGIRDALEQNGFTGPGRRDDDRFFSPFSIISLRSG